MAADKNKFITKCHSLLWLPRKIARKKSHEIKIKLKITIIRLDSNKRKKLGARPQCWIESSSKNTVVEWQPSNFEVLSSTSIDSIKPEVME